MPMTLPPDDLELVHLTDPHLFGDPAGRLRGIPSLPALHATLELARDDIARADALLLTGDLVQDDPAGYAHIRAAFGGLGRPVLTVAGNHDVKAPMRTALAGAPFQIGGHRDLGSWRVVLLDSAVEGRASGALDPAELQRLAKALESAGDRHVLICLHHHPVSLDSRWLDQVALQQPEAFLGLADRHPAVRGTVFGHVHQPHDSQRGHVRVLGTPSTCAQFLPRSDRFQVDSRPPAYRHLVLRANGAISTRLGWVGAPSGSDYGDFTATSQNSLRA